MAERELLFVGGCPRSGTTALTRLLNRHRSVLLGNERYYLRWENGTLGREHFARERFLAIQEGDTHPRDPGLVFGERAHWVGEDAAAKWDEARLIGDKHPPMWRIFSLIEDRFPNAHILFVLRNPLSVAESYQARFDDAADHWPFDAARGVRDWNDSVTAAAAALRRGARMTVVAYETMFRSMAAVGAMLTRLGLGADFARPVDDLVGAAGTLADKSVRRNEALRRNVALTADFESYRTLAAAAVA